MAVAKTQIEDLYGVLLCHISPEDLAALLVDIKRTVAYQSNRSFRDTIDRLQRRHRGT